MLTVLKYALGAVICALLSALVLSFFFDAKDVDLWRFRRVGALAGILVFLVAVLFLPRSRPVPLPSLDENEAAGAAPSAPKKRPLLVPRRLLWAHVSPKNRWLKVSSRLKKLLRRPGKLLREQSVFEILHPEDVPHADRAFQEALQKKETVTVTLRFFPRPAPAPVPTAPEDKGSPPKKMAADTAVLPTLDPDAVCHLRMRAKPCFDDKGKLVWFHCTFTDITRQARAEQELRRRSVEVSMANKRLGRLTGDLERLKKSYFDLYHHAPVMYFRLDVDGRLVTVNDTLLRTLGYQRQEIVKHSYTELLAPAALVEGEKQFGVGPTGTPAAQALTRDTEVETLWRKKDGAILDVWIRTVPVPDEDGRFVQWRGAALDLTERNRLAKELRARGDELEHTNTRLRHINRELEDFTHVVSHDLKEPLRTLQAYSNVLAEDFAGQLGPDGFQYINHLVQASRRLGHLIDDLLTLSQAGRIKGAFQVFNLIEAVATVRTDLVDLLQRKEATVLTEGSLPTVSGDQHRVTQLLTNLVANGLKYNNNPVPQVIIGQVDGEVPPGVPEDLDPHQAVIYVRDNGIGIDKRYHQQIFGIFRRLHQPEEYEGTGAGLAICQKIVQAHGGRIWVDSELGQGSTFYFSLPRPPLPKQARTSRNETGVEGPGSGPRGQGTGGRDQGAGGKHQILLVEDMVEVGMVIQRLGQRSGLDVTHVLTAEEAWDFLQTREPDLLLLDINLPGMSGIELCRKVRRELERLAVPIVLFSQEQSAEELAKLHEAGANHVLSKDLLTQPPLWQKRLQEILQGMQALPQPLGK